MRKMVRLILSLFTLFFLSSCDPCANLDCMYDSYIGQFRIVSASGNNDLVFGPDRIYDKNKIKFFTLIGQDTVSYDYETKYFPGSGYDSILSVLFFPKSDIAYMRLSNGDVDTLNISFKTTDSKCCGTVTQITNFRLNNVVNIPGTMGTQEIRK